MTNDYMSGPYQKVPYVDALGKIRNLPPIELCQGAQKTKPGNAKARCSRCSHTFEVLAAQSTASLKCPLCDGGKRGHA